MSEAEAAPPAEVSAEAPAEAPVEVAKVLKINLSTLKNSINFTIHRQSQQT